jgi:peptidyl-prolyl cis-trans isomerase D
MLDFLRKRRRSWVVTILLGVIVFVFVLWGVGSYVNEPRLDSVAVVNGEVISQREFEMRYQRFIDLYRDLFKGALTQETIRGLNLKSAILEELVQRRLLMQEARRLGLEMTDEELMDSIARLPDFQVNGRFNKNRYLQALRSRRLTPGQYEIERREQITIQKLYDIIQDTVHVTEAEVRDRYRLEQERINLYFIRLSASDFMPQAQVTAEEMKSYYERNREALKEPLRVQVEYLAYPFDHFSSKVQVSEKEIEEFYKINREGKFHQPNAVRLRHILFRLPAGAEPQLKETVRLRAEEVLREARGGKDFAQLAKEFSEDASAAQGGDIGFFTQGQMPPPLEKAAFALKKGEISNVLETTLGYHILKAEEIREGKTKSLKEATGEIIRAIKGERGKTEAAKAVEVDREKAISGTELSLLAKERGFPLVPSRFFSRSEVLPEVGPVEEFNKTAFSLSVKEISPAIEGTHAYYLLRVRERKEPSIPPLDGVRSDLEKRLRETKAFEMATQRAGTLLGQLKKEKDIKKLAHEHGLLVEETGWFFRNASEIPKVGILQEAKPGGIPISLQQPIPDRAYTQKASVFLFAFKESQGPDMERFEKEKGRLQEQALTETRQRALQKFVDSLKAKAQIEIQAKILEEG